MSAEDDLKNLPGYMLGKHAARIEGLEAAFNAMRGDFSTALTALKLETNQRFIRLEDAIATGFRQSQSDREAQGQTLGDMINDSKAETQIEIGAFKTDLAKELRSINSSLDKGKGGLSVGVFVTIQIITIMAALLGARLIFGH